MAEEDELEEEFEEDLEGDDEEGEAKPGRGKLIGVLALSAILGIGGGTFVLPIFLGGSSAQAESSSEPEEEGGGGGHGGAAPVGKVFSLSNIVVNARGSGGNRLLVATIAVEVDDGNELAELQEREIQLRDEVATILESIPMGILVRLGARDTVKNRVREMLHNYLQDAHPRVYVPQFVLQ